MLAALHDVVEQVEGEAPRVQGALEVVDIVGPGDANDGGDVRGLPPRGAGRGSLVLLLGLPEDGEEGQVGARRLAHDKQGVPVPAKLLDVLIDPAEGVVEVLEHVPDGSLGEVPVVREHHDHIKGRQHLGDKHAPGLVANEPAK